MAPPRSNTHRLNLDYISQIKQLFPATRHAYEILKLERGGVDYRRFSAALQHGYLTHAEILVIEDRWEAWKKLFLADEHAVYFELPDELAPVRERMP